MTVTLSSPEWANRIIWVLWLASWLAAAAFAARTVKRPGLRREVPYRVLAIVGTMLLFHLYRADSAVDRVLWTPTALVAWALVALTLAGLLFTWWARISIGRLWSSSVTSKADHNLIDSGPYRLVRHPIYTGIILATVATAALSGTVLSWAGVAVLTGGWYVKARLEEDFLREQLGAETYDGYVRRVPMFVPFLGPRRSG